MKYDEDAQDKDVLSRPLIEDEKVRKAVRAWADTFEINDNDKPLLFCKADKSGAVLEVHHRTWAYRLDADNYPFTKLKMYRSYTIDEICGEEE